MPERTFVLSDAQDNLIEALVESGRFATTTDVVDEALRLVGDQERDEAARRDALLEAVHAGIDAIERGDFKEFANVEELNAYLTAITDDVVAGNLEPASQD